MPQLSNQDEVELLAIGPFLGLDTTTASYFVDDFHGTDMVNVVPNRKYQGYLTVKGRVHALASNLASAGYGLFKFSRQGMTTVYLAAVNSGGNGVIQQFALGGTPANLTLPSGVTLTQSKRTNFVPYQGWTFTTNGTDTPLKIDTSLNVTRWGITAPATAPSVALGAAGNLIGTVSPYYYRVTFGNGSQESSPGPVSASIAPNSQQVSLTSIPTSTDPQVTQRNIYRLGGTLGQWILVATINDNTTTTYTDNTADANMTGQNLILHRDPPQAFYALETHKGRVWGFGYSGQAVGAQTGVQGTSDLWYSNYEEPWGFDNTNQVLPVGRNAGGDIAVGLASLGGVLVCFKSKSTQLVYGDTQADFIPSPAFPIGCVSQQSIAKAYGGVFWLSEQGVYYFDGNAPQYLSAKIKRTLDGFVQADFNAAVGFVYDHAYYLSFPTQGITFLYDMASQEWFKLGFACDNAVFDLENLGEVTATEIGTGVVDSWFAAETDLGSPIASTYTSKLGDSNALQATKRYRHVVLVAPVQAGATAAIQTLVDPGTSQKSHTKTVDLGQSPPRHAFSLPPNMVGFQAQIIVSVTSSSLTEVQRAALYGWVERQFVPQG